MPNNSIQERQRWEQALEAMEKQGVLNLTIAQLVAILEAIMEAEAKGESDGPTSQPVMWERLSSMSAVQAARSYCLRLMTAEHSALLSLTEIHDYANSLTVRRALTSYTGGQSTILRAWGLLSQLALLDDLRVPATATPPPDM